jgi:heme-binding NEAT domain protein
MRQWARGTGQPITPAPETTAVEEKTEEVFSLIDAEIYEALASMMAKGIAEVLTRDAVLNTWAHVAADTGILVTAPGIKHQ